MDWMQYINILSAALVPVIAIAGTWISILQHKTNERRRRHELFDRRLPLYEATVDFVSTITDTETVDLEKLDRILKIGAGSQFLFGEDVATLIQSFIDNAYLLDITKRDCQHSPDQAERDRACRAKSDLLRWFRECQNDLPQGPFRKYLKVEQ